MVNRLNLEKGPPIVFGGLFRGLDDLRVGRILMLTLIAGSTAYGFGGSIDLVWQVAAAVSLLAAGALYLINLGEWRKDRAAGKAHNPIAKGLVSPEAGFAVALAGLLGGLIWGSCLSEEIILAVASVVFVAGGRALGFFGTPILGAISLGALDGLAVLIGGLAVGKSGLGPIGAALFLACATTGGRIFSDLGYPPLDSMDEAATIPRKYGLKRSFAFLIACESAAYIAAYAAFRIGDLGPGFLYSLLVLAAIRTSIVIFLAIKPNPRAAGLAVHLSFGFLGLCYICGMLLGRR